MRSRAIAAIVVILASIGVAVAAWQARDTGVPAGATPAGSGVLTGVILTDTTNPQPVRRATVRLSGEAIATPRLVGTNDEGRFVFDRLPAGRFTVSATKAGFVQAFHGSTRPGRGPGVPVAVADGQTVDVAIKLLPGAAITGVITDGRGTPMPGVTVAAVDTRASGATTLPVRVVTDDRGMYRLFGLAPGEYLVSALPQLVPASAMRGGPASTLVTAVTDADVQWAKTLGMAPTPAGAGAGGGPGQPGRPITYAPVFYPGTTDAAAAATIRVASGEERAGVDMSLQIVALSRLAGTIVDERGQPVTSATVSLVPKRGDQPSPVDALVASGALALPRAIVSASGFAFSGVAPGRYTLIARTGSGQRGAGRGRGGLAHALECPRPHRRRQRSQRSRPAPAARRQGDGTIRLRAGRRASVRSGDAESVARGDQPASWCGRNLSCRAAGRRHVPDPKPRARQLRCPRRRAGRRAVGREIGDGERP